MTNIEIRVNGASAVKVKQEGLLTAGMVGATATFAFDSAWAGLTKTAVFRCGGLVRDVIGVEDSARIPTEVLCADADLYVGVEGRSSDGSVVIPTVWVRAAYVYPGANASGDPSVDSELPVWAQIQAMIGDLAKLGTVDKSSLVAAVNEALRSGGGTVSQETIARLVEEYLAENPPAQGEPGVSATHSWDGTVLTITSASGTSSADLKGEPGKDGEDGADGSPGKDGEDGKSAYQYAQDAGYGGTEEEFAKKLAEDAPSGGGSGGWKKLIDYTTTEDVFAGTDIKRITFDKDKDGNPLDAKMIFVQVSGKMTGGTTVRMFINDVTNFYPEFNIGASAGSTGTACLFVSVSANKMWQAFGTAFKTAFSVYGGGNSSPESIQKIAFGDTSYTLTAGAKIEVWEVERE